MTIDINIELRIITSPNRQPGTTKITERKFPTMHAKTLNHNNFSEAFEAIATLLRQYEPIWRSQPFIEEHDAWHKTYPKLYQTLMDLSADQLAALDHEDTLQQFLSPYLPGLNVLEKWTISNNNAPILPMEKFADVGINGRKVTQICGFASWVSHSFASQLTPLKNAAEKPQIIDWCSGKGHLAKQLHYCTQLPVTCLEYDDKLCLTGQSTTSKLNYPITFINHNVLSPLPNEPELRKAFLYSALHACGDLHLAMLKAATEGDIQHIAWSPCCYHLTRKAQYAPLSTLGKKFDFGLTPQLLRLAVTQLVTGGNRVKRLRQQELLWRIGFDLLHRSITGDEAYRPMPSIPKKWLSGSFEDYCQFMAQKIELKLTSNPPKNDLLKAAALKLQRIERLEKAKLGFRRALEYYLVLDQVLSLQEKGYHLEMTTFCDAKVTPRNIALVAQKVTHKK